MIKADFIEIDGKLVAPTIIEGSELELLFELDSVFKSFIKNDKSKELLHAVLQNNLDDINKQMDKNELNEERYYVYHEVLERNNK